MAKPGRPVSTSDPAPGVLRDFRAKFKLTQEEAAGLFGVSTTTWGSWELGQRPQATARLLATLLLAKPELIKLFLEE